MRKHKRVVVGRLVHHRDPVSALGVERELRALGLELRSARAWRAVRQGEGGIAVSEITYRLQAAAARASA